MDKKIIVRADRGDKQEGASAAQKLINRDNYVAILGYPTAVFQRVVAITARQAPRSIPWQSKIEN
jgi:hypothetical protein